jgi:Glycosyl hydrolase family 26
VLLVKTERAGRHRQALPLRPPVRRNRAKWVAVVAVTSAVALIVSVFVVLVAGGKAKPTVHPRQGHTALPATPGSYLGVYADGVPSSYAGVTAFTSATGVKPRLVVYYSGWLEPFRTSFAASVTKHGAVPLVQIDPSHVSLAAIANGQYDAYLTSYARAVRAYRNPVVLGFGHEMNGTWFSWGYTHTSPATFVAAWRHIVTLFRANGARNVTWMWTVNIIKTKNGQIPSPAPWWPGKSYVNWVGIDGYYLNPSWQFAPIFGPTITAVRELTGDPILIAETGATHAASQPTNIGDVFAGVHEYGLLGLVWFDSTNGSGQDFGIRSPAAIAAFRRGAKTYIRPSS